VLRRARLALRSIVNVSIPALRLTSARIVALELLLAFVGHLHEFPADTVANRGQFDRRTAVIYVKSTK
jgi:hypothetical protein